MGMSGTRTIEAPVGAEIVVDGRRYVNFGGSSYLGLSTNAEIIEAGVVALRENGSGYQFARQYQIASRAHQEAEKEAAAFFNSQAALYLAGGYYFGLVALAAIREKFTAIFFDELAHHCLREAIAVSGLRNQAFRHLDPEDLAARLRTHLGAGDKPLVVTDGLYSTFGEIAPLADLLSVVTPYGGGLVVDESHSFGVLGATGRGLSEHHGIASSSLLIGGSTCKGFGVVGGLILASECEVEALRATPASRGASAGLPAAAAMCASSLRYIREHPEILTRLRSNISYAKSGLRNLGLEVGSSVAPVATFSAGSGTSMQLLQERLMSQGIYVLHSTYIGAGAAGVIRCGIFADHTQRHFDCLFDALRRLL